MVVQGLSSLPVTSEKDILDALDKGNENKTVCRGLLAQALMLLLTMCWCVQVASTAMNERSSRSACTL